MSLPANHRDIVEAIMVSASRFRGMVHSELGHLDHIDAVLDNTMPYLYQGEESPIINACGRYLDHPTGIGFYNIITACKREPALEMYLKLYQDMELPKPDMRWCLDD